MEKREWQINVFSVLTIVFLIMVALLYVQVFVRQDFLILTTEEEIDEFKSDTFGVFADYI